MKILSASQWNKYNKFYEDITKEHEFPEPYNIWGILYRVEYTEVIKIQTVNTHKADKD